MARKVVLYVLKYPRTVGEWLCCKHEGARATGNAIDLIWAHAPGRPSAPSASSTSWTSYLFLSPWMHRTMRAWIQSVLPVSAPVGVDAFDPLPFPPEETDPEEVLAALFAGGLNATGLPGCRGSWALRMSRFSFLVSIRVPPGVLVPVPPGVDGLPPSSSENLARLPRWRSGRMVAKPPDAELVPDMLAEDGPA